MRWSIGAVVFGVINPSTGVAHYKQILGDQRIDLLRRAYRRQPLPDRLVMLGQRDGGGFQPITWDDVYWDTAGPRVTED